MYLLLILITYHQRKQNQSKERKKGRSKHQTHDIVYSILCHRFGTTETCFARVSIITFF